MKIDNAIKILQEIKISLDVKVSEVKESKVAKVAQQAFQSMAKTLSAKGSLTLKTIVNLKNSSKTFMQSLHKPMSQVRVKANEIALSILTGLKPLKGRVADAVSKIFNKVPSEIPDDASKLNGIKLPNKGDGKEISKTYEHGGVEYGKEVITRRDFKTGIAEGKTWVSSNNFRDLVKAHGFDEACKLTSTKPVNLRYQSVKTKNSGKADESKKIGFARLGVITDARNGFTNLKELRALRGDPKAVDQKIKDILGKTPDKNANQLRSISRAVAQLSFIDETIKERETVLNDQFVELLKLQIEKKKPEGDSFSLVHLSLLNPKTDTLDKNGWMHNETNAILDMAEIFSDANGKTIFFDGADPAVDDDGNYHLSPAHGRGKESIELKASFFNVSVQGNVNNDNTQRLVNMQGLKNLGPMDKELIELFDTDKFGYKSAEEIGEKLLGKGALSLCCASGKDRTGLVAARLVQRKLGDQAISDEAKEKFANSVLDADSPASRVVADNTGATILKINPKQSITERLPGLSRTTQFAFLARQAVALIKGEL